MSVWTEKDFASAMEREDDEIIVEGDLANTTLKIKATGKIAWGIAFAAIIAAVGLAMTGAGIPVALPLAGAATAILGAGAVSSAIAIAVAAGGAGILTSLRDNYKVVEHSHNRLVLKRT